MFIKALKVSCNANVFKETNYRSILVNLKFKFKVLNQICSDSSLARAAFESYLYSTWRFLCFFFSFSTELTCFFNIPCYALTVCAFSQQLWFNVELFAPASVQKLPIQIKTSPNKSGGMCNCPHLFYAPGLFENWVFVLYLWSSFIMS